LSLDIIYFNKTMLTVALLSKRASAARARPASTRASPLSAESLSQSSAQAQPAGIDRKQTALARSQAEFGFGALEKVTAAPSVEGGDHSR